MPDSHPLAVGVLGRSGTPIASWFMNGCDLQIVFGASFSNHTSIEKKKKTIQVDFERMALGKFHAAEIPVWGEIGRTCELIEGSLKETSAVDQRQELIERWRMWREEKDRRVTETRGRGFGVCADLQGVVRVRGAGHGDLR